MKNIPLRKIVETMHKNNLPFTLVGIGPMSELIVESALELGKELDFPVILIASRAQIDAEELGGGYVNNWNQKTFNEFVQKKKKEIGFHGLLYLCRDHGGPWQRSDEKKLTYEEAMERAKISYVEDIKNGFNFIHLDPTLDPSMDNLIPLELVANRTMELLRFLEEKRKNLNIPEISYECGTDETSGDLTSFDGFEEFTKNMVNKIKKENLPMPAFIVGQTGTLVKMKRNVGKFDLPTATKLNQITKKYGVGFKEHNGDYIPEEDLLLHPKHRITATNVAPEFGVAETTALIQLTAKEEIAHKMGEDFTPSNFFKIISGEVIKSGKWKKWLTKQERNLTAEQIEQDPEKKLEITLVAGHYTFANPKIIEARKQLYENLKKLNVFEYPEKVVKYAIKKSIQKYIKNFNLVSSTTKILNKLEEDKKIKA